MKNTKHRFWIKIRKNRIDYKANTSTIISRYKFEHTNFFIIKLYCVSILLSLMYISSSIQVPFYSVSVRSHSFLLRSYSRYRSRSRSCSGFQFRFRSHSNSGHILIRVFVQVLDP